MRMRITSYIRMRGLHLYYRRVRGSWVHGCAGRWREEASVADSQPASHPANAAARCLALLRSQRFGRSNHLQTAHAGS